MPNPKPLAQLLVPSSDNNNPKSNMPQSSPKSSSLTLSTEASQIVQKLKTTFPTPSAFLQHFNPNLQTTLLTDPRTLAQLSMASAPTLALIDAAFPIEGTNIPSTGQTWLRVQIQNLLDYAEQPLGVSTEHIDNVTKIIYHTYPYLNILEFMRFFLDCKRAIYGSFYGTTGPMQIIEKLNKFVLDRQKSIQQYEQEQEQLQKEQRLKETSIINAYAEYQALKQAAQQGDTEAINKLNELIHHKS